MKNLSFLSVLLFLANIVYSDPIVYSWDFETDGESMSWVSSEIDDVTIQNGVLSGKTTDENANITISQIPTAAKLTTKDYIEIRMRQRTDDSFGIFGASQAKIAFITSNNNDWDNSTQEIFESYGSNKWYIHKIYVGEKPNWVSASQFRIYPNNKANAIVEIDYIKIMRDETPPEYVLQNIQSLRNGQVISNNTPTMKIMRYFDNAVGIDRVEFYYRPGASRFDTDWVLDGITDDPTYGYRHTFKQLPNGTYDFAAQIIDRAGNRHPFTSDESKWIDNVVIDSDAQTIIRVKPNKITNPIRKEIPSQNISWGHWTNLYDQSSGLLNPEMENRLRELKIPILRYPGGCLADTFYWKLSVGPVENRPEQFSNACNPTLNKSGIAKFGLDEFVRFCKARNMEPMITLRFRHDKQPGDTAPDCSLDGRDGLTPFQEALEDAVHLVEYLNAPVGKSKWADLRAANGHPEPYNVKFFEIGNEPWGPDPFGSPRPNNELGKDAAEIYALYFIKYYEAMKAVDPNIYVSAAGNIGNQPHISEMNEMWDPIVFAVAGQYMDAFHTHPYKPYSTYWDRDDDARYWKTLVSPDRFDDDLDNQRRFIRDWSGDRLGNLRLLLNEWNVNFSWSWKGAIYEGDSLLAAMALAGFWNTMADNYDIVDSSGWWHMYGGRPYSIFSADGSITPLFNVFRMYVDHFQDNKLVSYVDGVPTYDYPGCLHIYFPEMNGVPMISTTATLSDDGSKLSLTVVNKDKYQNRTVNIDLDDFVPKDVNIKASVYSLTGSNPHNVRYLLDEWVDENSSWEVKTSDAVMTETTQTFQNGFTYEFPKHSVVAFLFEKEAE